ncbi:hypothetical protein BGZ99_008208 [Dissophora globulifera]|uniref:tRNA ligase n=1 Tax=Dissophora globulifera TaxID=979702 RepID=A0A9P6RBV8_9FUNG|nr:hypothetical protein BGZ99_008208 [Dissophora globulifera]
MDQITTQLARTQIHDEQARADSLIRSLHAYVANNISSSRHRRNLVHANPSVLDLDKERDASQQKNAPTINGRRISAITVTSWKMSEFEYVKGTLPTLARGLFTYQDPTLPQSPSTLHHNEKNTTKDKSESKAKSLAQTTAASDPTTPGAGGDDVDDNNGLHRILIRGYDKFFNIGEVEKTRPEWIAANTEGPYEVTLKENGCIIFMAGLPPHLVGPQGGCVVSSKHALGNPDIKNVTAQTDGSHSTKGREWLERCLAAKGKTLQQFGLWLWNQNLTAVAELCDDSFEEHILQYPADKSGLYLHGLNLNTVQFETLPSSKVQEAAQTWGFRRTDCVSFNSYKEVKSFTDSVGEAGEYNDRPIEGFVVRCRIKEDGRTHFIKIKYDEPYLMYREWREITKMLWADVKKAKAAADAAHGSASVPRPAGAGAVIPDGESRVKHIKYQLTRPYIEFVKALMQEKPELFAEYNKNQGIIAIRDMFLKEWESKASKEQDSLLAVSSPGRKTTDAVVEDFERTVLIPIATIGCGKTTVSVALSKLFGWTHVSSDDFNHMKKSGQRFIDEVVQQLKDNTVVIADRNNFESVHRERIMEGVRKRYPRTRFVALYWRHDKLPFNRIREIETERVIKRGSNHQSLTPEYCPEFEGIIYKFLKDFQPLNRSVGPDSGFHYVIESNVGEDTLTMVERITKEFATPMRGARGIDNRPIPTPEEIKEAVRYAIEDWQPIRIVTGEVAKHFKSKQASQASHADRNPEISSSAVTTVSNRSRKKKEPKFYAVSLEDGHVKRFMDDIVQSDQHKGDPTWTQLKNLIKEWNENYRIGNRQHVTLIHVSTLKDTSEKRAKRAEEIWKLYTDELSEAAASFALSTVSSPMAVPSTATDQPAAPASVARPLGEASDEFKEVKRRSKKDKVSPPAAAIEASSSTSTLASASTQTETATAAAALPLSSGLTAWSEPPSTLEVDHIVWTERVVALRVSRAKRPLNGKPYETTQQMLHITVGTAGDHIKPFESNDLLRLWATRQRQTASAASDGTGPKIYSIKLDTPKVFAGHLKAMMF